MEIGDQTGLLPLEFGPQEVAEQLRAYEAAGVEEIMAQFLVVDDFEGIRVLGEEVVPLLA